MDRADLEKRVITHYTPGDITGRILAALGLTDARDGSVAVSALYPVDQLHHGGLGLTERMAALAGIQAGQRVLDAGSGIGGSSRFLADRFGCEVDAIDLSDAYVQTSKDLDALVGLAGKISHRAGSVTALPYDDARFEVVWSQNVTMNVADKGAMFSEAFRVLKPGGMYVLSHIGESGKGAIDYPIPWAMMAEMSFATSPKDMVQALGDAGFTDVTDHATGAPPPPPPPVAMADDTAAMGDDMPERRANSGKAVGDGRLVPMLITAKR